MATKALPSQEVLRQLLDYDPIAGKLFWKGRPLSSFANEGAGRAWNKRFAGTEAFTALSVGYPHGNLFAVKYMAHRIAWVWMFGQIAGEIDHIDGNKRNFAIGNLRDVDRPENMRNLAKNRKNASGHSGVSLCRQTGKWRAGIQVNGRHVCLGRYRSLDDAVAARREGEAIHGFHPNHGR